MSKTDLELEQLLEKSLSNIDQDRACARSLLISLMEHIVGDVERNREYGLIASKYLETLQRSNEQLVKISELMRKQKSIDNTLSDEEREDLFDEIKEDIK